jgi:hypothetical protein
MSVISLSERRRARAEPPLGPDKPIPDHEFRGWLEDLDNALDIFMSDFSPCPCDQAAELLTASIEQLVARRQPLLDAIAEAEKARRGARMLTSFVGADMPPTTDVDI